MLPGIAGVVVRGVELLELLPTEVGNGQRLSAGHHRVRVVRIKFVLEVLSVQTLVVRLPRNKNEKSQVSTRVVSI